MFIKTSQIKLAFNIIQLIQIWRICLEQTFSDSFCDKVFNIAKSSKYDSYHHSYHVLQCFIVFHKKSSDGAVIDAGKSSIKRKIMPNQQLAEELHKPIIRKFEKKKVYSSFKDNIWGVNLAHLQLISRYKKGF